MMGEPSTLLYLLTDAVNSFAEDAESLADRIRWIIETQFDKPSTEED